MRGQSLRLIAPTPANHRNGTMEHHTQQPSQQTMSPFPPEDALEAFQVMPRFSTAYCGMRWYLAKASAHSAPFSGGIAPMMGSHSVMERPEPVSRVSPPMVTMARITSATASSQKPTARRDFQKFKATSIADFIASLGRGF